MPKPFFASIFLREAHNTAEPHKEHPQANSYKVSLGMRSSDATTIWPTLFAGRKQKNSQQTGLVVRDPCAEDCTLVTKDHFGTVKLL